MKKQSTGHEEFDGRKEKAHRQSAIDVEFASMPSIRLESYEAPAGASWLQRLALATRRRRFSLLENWQIKLNNVGYFDELNGVVEIPAQHSNNRPVVFDGASVPFPWLISLLTVGILRPLGIMLIGSIVHDYAYQHGKLRIARDEANTQFEPVPLTRDQADRLFRDIISSVNRLPVVGQVAWFAVRIGWYWVRFNGRRFGGRPPVKESVLLLLILLVLGLLLSALGLLKFLTLATAGYFLFYFASLFANKRLEK